MAKKYLLYIHQEEFEAEEHKSELIDSLLAKHYGNTPRAKEASFTRTVYTCKKGHAYKGSKCVQKGCL